jgi:hypothetical protein
VESARKMLGIANEQVEPSSEAFHGLSSHLAATGISDTCNACGHFTPDADHCKIHDNDRKADDPACRFIDRSGSA